MARWPLGPHPRRVARCRLDVRTGAGACSFGSRCHFSWRGVRTPCAEAGSHRMHQGCLQAISKTASQVQPWPPRAQERHRARASVASGTDALFVLETLHFQTICPTQACTKPARGPHAPTAHGGTRRARRRAAPRATRRTRTVHTGRPPAPPAAAGRARSSGVVTSLNVAHAAHTALSPWRTPTPTREPPQPRALRTKPARQRQRLPRS